MTMNVSLEDFGALECEPTHRKEYSQDFHSQNESRKTTTKDTKFHETSTSLSVPTPPSAAGLVRALFLRTAEVRNTGASGFDHASTTKSNSARSNTLSGNGARKDR
jgi:hypothetical protein